MSSAVLKLQPAAAQRACHGSRRSGGLKSPGTVKQPVETTDGRFAPTAKRRKATGL